MKPASDILERVYAAANNLFEQGGRVAFPTVDTVRKVARVNMNDANSGMREWRRQQMARAVSTPAQIPAAIAQAQATLVAEVWQIAQTAASESLAVAQAAWDAERGQLEILNKEMADAFEAQADELGALRAGLQSASERADNAARLRARAQDELNELRTRLAAAESDTRCAVARVEEIVLRASDLRQALDQAHQELAVAHTAMLEAARAHADELTAVRADARQAESILCGELEDLRRQQRDLMQIVSSVASPASPHPAPYN